MNVSDLNHSELRSLLKSTGLTLQTGPFITHIQSSISSVSENIALLYADHALAEDNGFADFHVQLAPPGNLRHWFRPQVLFSFDNRIPFKPLPLDQAFPMLEWGMNWCVSGHSHQYLILHAAVLEMQGRAVILPAPPGSGKSTLCAALANRGWRLLSDELTLISKAGGALVPLCRPVSLKNQSIQVIRNFEPTAVLSRAVRDTVKGTVAHMKPPATSVAQSQLTAMPAWIVFPKYQAGAETQLAMQPKSRAFMQMIENAFNYSLLGAQGFHMMTDLIDRCDCYDFTYSNLDEAIAVFADLTPPAI
ncbi:HprK-related kinase A [Sulfurirhabdus autotrophica]|uniref:Hpr(Ser) kinase/phosphatase n=1 Tax=Sulfurirhabdus autotrophica TaxID=1706046 RepID=A0A4R3Y0K3_9PROT|nr:HprK-related kinase A [Sulfurirhabdus autotrophica]TCV84158.1 Hpr(Ser) kinase/phosphatase [Sulfurirhabdus autotrophica]